MQANFFHIRIICQHSLLFRFALFVSPSSSSCFSSLIFPFSTFAAVAVEQWQKLLLRLFALRFPHLSADNDDVVIAPSPSPSSIPTVALLCYETFLKIAQIFLHLNFFIRLIKNVSFWGEREFWFRISTRVCQSLLKVFSPRNTWRIRAECFMTARQTEGGGERGQTTFITFHLNGSNSFKQQLLKLQVLLISLPP